MCDQHPFGAGLQQFFSDIGRCLYRQIATRNGRQKAQRADCPAMRCITAN
jgi:hypothetical protein